MPSLLVPRPNAIAAQDRKPARQLTAPRRESARVATRSVTIVQRILPEYRIPLFSRLHEQLETRGIALRVLYGDEQRGTVPRTVHSEAPWAKWINNRYWRIGDREIVWQSCLPLLEGSELVVIEQANRLLINHLLLAGRSQRRIAYWGHGMNFQARNRNSLSERFKRHSVHKAHWWFPYTDASARIITRLGYPAERITVVNNSVDSTGLSRAIDALTAADLARVRNDVGASSGPVILYCGRLVTEKRIDLLLATAHALRQINTEFTLVVIGDGPLTSTILREVERHPWIRYVGRLFGAATAPYFAIADLVLMPGAMGLVLVDAFAAGVPIVTTNIRDHGPEFDYLKPGKNGIIVDPDARLLARACARLLRAPAELSEMRTECRAAAQLYTIDAMSQRFAEGIERALSA